MTHQSNVTPEPLATGARPPMTHSLKTDPEVFAALRERRKSFEIRKDDRGFQVGDELLLVETEFSGAEMAAGAPLRSTGNVEVRRVTYILSGYGLEPGWVIMSVVPAWVAAL